MSSMIYDILYTEPTAGNTLLRAHIICDTAADLPAYNAYSGYELLMGSIADDLSTGDSYKMLSGGSWVRQPVAQSDTYTTTQIDNLLSDKIPYSTPGTILATDDIDNYATGGTWFVTAGAAHTPVANARGRLDVIILASDVVQQRYATPGSTNRLYVRNSSSLSPLAWHPWVPIWTANLGIGSAMAANDNLNSYTTYGVYVAASTAIASSIQHRPAYTSPGTKMFIVECTAIRFNILQTLIACDISTANFGAFEKFYRIGKSDGSEWGSWYQMSTSTVPDYP